jgi:hypothetical protein
MTTNTTRYGDPHHEADSWMKLTRIGIGTWAQEYGPRTPGGTRMVECGLSIAWPHAAVVPSLNRR